MSTKGFAQSRVVRARESRAQIVIVGRGFGGPFGAEALRGTTAEVQGIDRNHYHLYRPRLYQVACAALALADIAAPIRT